MAPAPHSVVLTTMLMLACGVAVCLGDGQVWHHRGYWHGEIGAPYLTHGYALIGINAQGVAQPYNYKDAVQMLCVDGPPMDGSVSTAYSGGAGGVYYSCTEGGSAPHTRTLNAMVDGLSGPVEWDDESVVVSSSEGALFRVLTSNLSVTWQTAVVSDQAFDGLNTHWIPPPIVSRKLNAVFMALNIYDGSTTPATGVHLAKFSMATDPTHPPTQDWVIGQANCDTPCEDGPAPMMPALLEGATAAASQVVSAFSRATTDTSGLSIVRSYAASDGKLQWQYPTSGIGIRGPFSGATATGGSTDPVCVCHADGSTSRVICLNPGGATPGSETWPPVTLPTAEMLPGNIGYGATVCSAPLVVTRPSGAEGDIDTLLIVTDTTGIVAAVDAAKGALVWSRSLGAALSSSGNSVLLPQPVVRNDPTSGAMDVFLSAALYLGYHSDSTPTGVRVSVSAAFVSPQSGGNSGHDSQGNTPDDGLLTAYTLMSDEASYGDNTITAGMVGGALNGSNYVMVSSGASYVAVGSGPTGWVWGIDVGTEVNSTYRECGVDSSGAAITTCGACVAAHGADASMSCGWCADDDGVGSCVALYQNDAMYPYSCGTDGKVLTVDSDQCDAVGPPHAPHGKLAWGIVGGMVGFAVLVCIVVAVRRSTSSPASGSTSRYQPLGAPAAGGAPGYSGAPGYGGYGAVPPQQQQGPGGYGAAPAAPAAVYTAPTTAYGTAYQQGQAQGPGGFSHPPPGAYAPPPAGGYGGVTVDPPAGRV